MARTKLCRWKCGRKTDGSVAARPIGVAVSAFTVAMRMTTFSKTAKAIRLFVNQWKRDHPRNMPLKRRRKADTGKPLGRATIARNASVKD
jgi:hypothetical protein